MCAFVSVPQIKKNGKPDDRLRAKFTAENSHSLRHSAGNLTPAARFLIFLRYAPKSVKPHVPHFQKAHPIGGIPLLSARIQSAVSPTIPNFIKQEKTGAVPTAADRI